MNRFIYLFLLLCFSVSQTYAHTFIIPVTVDWIRQVSTLPQGQSNQINSSLQLNARPGDTLLLEGRIRKPLRIDDLLGDSLHPIFICNQNVQVVFTQFPGTYYGMAFNACRYVKVSGKNNVALSYGIAITDLRAGSALSINNFSSNFEVEGLEISRIYSSGIVAKTDPNCANLAAYPSYVMYDLKFHHNYIHQTGNEGFYVGNTSYNEGNGIKVTCGTTTVSVLPHKIVGVKIYENRLDSTGWDAIQVASAEQVQVFDNYVSNDSYLDAANQQSGILIGQPCTGKVYRNTIINSNGAAIQCLGTGIAIYNNLIVNPGNSVSARGSYNSSGQLTNAQITYGIYLNDKVCKDANIPKLPYVVAHNTIIIQKVYRVGSPYNTWAPQGINANSLAYITGSFFGNNLLVIDSNAYQVNAAPVNGIFSSNSVPGYSILNAPAFISLNNKSNFGDNYYANEITALNFTDYAAGNYTLQSPSGAVNTGMGSAVSNYPYLNRDMLGSGRPQDSSPEFGCYEKLSATNFSSMQTMSIVPNPISIAGYAGRDFQLLVSDLSLDTDPSIEFIGTYSSVGISIQSIEIQNNKLVFTLPGNELPLQSGVYSVQLRNGGELKAYANVLILP